MLNKGYSLLNESKKAKDIQVVFLSARAEKTKKSSNSMFFFEDAAKKAGIKMVTIDPSSSTIKKESGDNYKVIEKTTEKKEYILNPQNTIIVPRRTVLKNTESKDFMLELQNYGFFCFNTLDTIETCEDKFLTYKKLKSMGVPTPKTIVITNSSMNKLDEKIEAIGGQFPVICKLSAGGTQGIGVFQIDSMVSLRSTLQTLFKISPKSDIILQEKINSDYDLRVHVLYDSFERIGTGLDNFKVIGVMKRNQLAGDFRSNFSLGSTAEKGNLTPEQEQIVKMATKAMSGRWIGVDLIVDGRTGQSYVIECNSSPGTKGIQTAAGEDVVGIIFEMFKNFKYTKYESNQIGCYETIYNKDLGIDCVIKFDSDKGFTEMECSSINMKDEEVSFVFNGQTYTRELAGVRKSEPLVEFSYKFNGTWYRNELTILKKNNSNINENIIIGGTKLLNRISNNFTVTEEPFILTDNTLNFEVPVVKPVDEGFLLEGRNWVFGVNDEDIKLSGLRKCIESFISGSRETYSRGKWKISNSNPDYEWEIYYNNQAFIGKKQNTDEVKFYHNYMPEKVALKISGVIESLLDVKVDLSKYENK